VCHLAIKVEKQLKGQRPYQTTSFICPQSTPKGDSSNKKVKTTPTTIKALIKGKDIASEM